jgi:hypothetical protein
LEKLFQDGEINPSDRPSDVRGRYEMFDVVPTDSFRAKFNGLKAKHGLNLRKDDDSKPTAAEGVAALSSAGIPSLKQAPVDPSLGMKMPPLAGGAPLADDGDDSKNPTVNWQPSNFVEIHTNSTEFRQTVVGALLCQAGISSVEEIKCTVVAPDCKKILIQQLVDPNFFDPETLIGAYVKPNTPCKLGAPLEAQSRFLALVEGCKRFTGGKKKKAVWASTYVELPVKVDKHLRKMKLIKKGSAFIFVFELNSADGDDWNNVDMADEIIEL